MQTSSSTSQLRVLVDSSIRRMRAEPIRPFRDLDRLDHDNRSWVQDRAIAREDRLESYGRIRVAACAANTYGECSLEVARLGADLVGWLFLFDDRYGEGEPGDDAATMIARFASYTAILRGDPAPSPATPFHDALVDLAARGRALGGDAWARRFADDMERYFDGCLQELPYRRGLAEPSIAEYRRVRVGSVGTIAVFDLIELALDRPLTDAEAATPALRAAKERAALLTAWVNDVYSYPKECDAGDPLNLVATLGREYGLSLEESFGAAAEVYNEDLRALDREAEEAITASRSPVVAAFVRGLYRWVHGNHKWTGSCGRYQ